ncbi:MAG TPA: lytic transglycosylase domain-containing protein [Salinarimonas sp.]|nr:lytic transglycosylase domain-containing protein [Salinarimonas sp.]
MRIPLAIGCVLALCAGQATAADRGTIDALVQHYAAAHGVPASLIHRVIRRESNYNARAVSRGNFGLMQIRHATARGMGYRGSAAGLLDAQTNMAYAVPYLANAYRVAGGSESRAVSLYSRGYYYEAKRQGLIGRLATGSAPAPVAVAAASPAPTPIAALFATPVATGDPGATGALAVEAGSEPVSRSELRRLARAERAQARAERAEARAQALAERRLAAAERREARRAVRAGESAGVQAIVDAQP